MWNKTKRWFSVSEEFVPNEEPEECKHDWEYLPCSTVFWRDGYFGGCAEWRHMEQPFCRERHSYQVWATRKVCLKCGKCINQEIEAEKQIQEKWDREELAEKLWEDCQK